MSLPHLLLVDDSEAILAYEKAALSGHYTLSTAVNGRDALAKIYQLKPAAILLDLSMPEMDGDEVLVKIKADPEVSKIPVIVVSSEKARAEACLKQGAAAYLPKPIRADELLALVTRTLEHHKMEERKGNMAILFVGVGEIDVGIPLDCVRTVLLQPETRTLPAGPSYLSELFEWHGQPVCVLDLAHRLGVEHELDITERKVVVVHHGQTLIGICVDRIRDPEEFPAAEITLRRQLSGSSEPSYGEALMAVVRTPAATMPIIDPRALLSRGMLRKLPSLLRQVQESDAQAPRAAAPARSAATPATPSTPNASATPPTATRPIGAGSKTAAPPPPPPQRPTPAAGMPTAKPAPATTAPPKSAGAPRPPVPAAAPLGGVPNKLNVSSASGPIPTKPIADPSPISTATSPSKAPR